MGTWLIRRHLPGDRSKKFQRQSIHHVRNEAQTRAGNARHSNATLMVSVMNRSSKAAGSQKSAIATPASPIQPIAGRFHELTQFNIGAPFAGGQDTPPLMACRRAIFWPYYFDMKQLSIIVCGILCGSSLAASADPLESLPSADASRIHKHLPGVVLGPAKDVPPLKDVKDWYPLQDATFRYDRPSSEDKKATLVLTSGVRAPGTPVGGPADGWMMTVSDGATRYLSNRPDEGILIPTEVSTSNGLIIQLNPPEPLVLVGLKEGQIDSRKIGVKIYDVHDPIVVTHSGSVTCKWTDLGGWKVKVPHGAYDTRLIRLTYDGSVGPASVSAQKYIFLATGIGAVAFTDARDLSAFIFFNDDSHHAGVLRTIEKHPAAKSKQSPEPKAGS